MCQTGGANTTQTTWYVSKWSQAGFALFSLFLRNLNRKKGFRAAIWNSTRDPHQMCALDFQRSQLKNVTVNDRQNTVNMRQNKGK
jgi:hypothetical protein